MIEIHNLMFSIQCHRGFAADTGIAELQKTVHCQTVGVMLNLLKLG